MGPSDVPGCKLWLPADGLALNDGDAVGTWADRSGLGNDFTQGTAGNKPTFKTSILNGRPVVRFDGVSDRVDRVTNPLSGAAAGEMFVVVKIANDPPSTSTKSGLVAFGASGIHFYYPFTDGIVYDDFGSTTRQTTVNPTPALTSWRLYNVSSAAGAWTSRLDGTQLYTTGTNTVGWSAAAQVGGSGNGFLNLDGDIAEFLVYDAVLSAANRNLLGGYFQSKYGLTIAGATWQAPNRRRPRRPPVRSSPPLAGTYP